MWVVGEEQGSGSRGGREGELMENGVVSQLIGDALAGLSAVSLMASRCYHALRHNQAVTSTAALSAQLLQVCHLSTVLLHLHCGY